MRIGEALIEAGRDIAINEARILLALVLKCEVEYLLMHSDKHLLHDQYGEFTSLVERRKNHEPVAYIIGSKEFYSRDFIVDPNVLIPRPDSEILPDAVMEYIKKTHHCEEGSDVATQEKFSKDSAYKSWVASHSFAMTNKKKSHNDELSILELGIGSGCLLLTLLLELPNAKGEGVDISDGAINVATKNMRKFEIQNRCKIYKSNWFEKVDGKFDIIISNPPYINKEDADIMAKETILYEPESALYAEDKGFAAYREIALHAKKHLKENGVIFLEIGLGQKDYVVQIFESQGFVLDSTHKDLAEIDRVLVFARNQVTL
jgi:release factor glutamine methyltransferase